MTQSAQCEICYGGLDSVCQSCDPHIQALHDDRDYQDGEIERLQGLIDQAGDHPLVIQEGGVNNIDRCHRVINKLVGAIRKHRDEFPDEALDGERELWSILEKI